MTEGGANILLRRGDAIYQKIKMKVRTSGVTEVYIYLASCKSETKKIEITNLLSQFFSHADNSYLEDENLHQ
jgi:hypothetical protein